MAPFHPLSITILTCLKMENVPALFTAFLLDAARYKTDSLATYTGLKDNYLEAATRHKAIFESSAYHDCSKWPRNQ